MQLYFKDTFEKGLEGVSLDEASHFLDTSSDINKKCFKTLLKEILLHILEMLLRIVKTIYIKCITCATR